MKKKSKPRLAPTDLRPRGGELRALSLFSGAGGLDIGVTQAGFKVLGCVESDPNCCKTLRLNASREGRSTSVLEGDIRQVDPDSLRKSLKLKRGELDLLFGGPPCQAFSQIGKMESVGDHRGLLLFEMIRFAKAFQPRAVLVEQVKGVLTAKDLQGARGAVFRSLLDQFRGLGYTAQWKVINATTFGVPQARERVFVVAVRQGCAFEFPDATHAQTPGELPLFRLKATPTVGDAIAGLGTPGTKGDQRNDSHIDITPAGDRYRIGGVPEGSFLAAQTHLPKEQVRNLQRKDTTKFLRVSRMKPANTLRCGEIFFHPLEDRYLTPREYMRLHGYPDDYLLDGPIRGRSGQVKNLDQHRQVANSVPPPVARALAEQLRGALECHNSLRSLATG